MFSLQSYLIGPSEYFGKIWTYLENRNIKLPVNAVSLNSDIIENFDFFHLDYQNATLCVASIFKRFLLHISFRNIKRKKHHKLLVFKFKRIFKCWKKRPTKDFIFVPAPRPSIQGAVFWFYIFHLCFYHRSLNTRFKYRHKIGICYSRFSSSIVRFFEYEYQFFKVFFQRVSK